MRTSIITTRLIPTIAISLALALSAAASLAAIPSVAQAASPSASTTYVTRGQYVEQLLQATGVQPTTTTTQQDFSDVPPSSPYFGWVEAAYKAGVTDGVTAPASGKMGVFGVGQDLTRAEAAAFDLRAYDGGVATYAEDPSTWHSMGYQWNPNMPAYHGAVSFSDYSQIPTALQGDVYTAASIGLLHGFPGGTFGPQQYLTTAQTADLISQLKTVEATAGAYHWRWITSGNGAAAERASSNALGILTGAVLGQPWSQVSQYVAPTDQSAVESAYQQVANNVHLWATSAPILRGTRLEVVGGVYGVGQAAADGGWRGTASVEVEAVSAASGQPISFAGNSPYFSIRLDVETSSDGCLVAVNSPEVNTAASLAIQPGQSVAEVLMGNVGGAAAVYPDSPDAAAVVAGLGQATTAQP